MPLALHRLRVRPFRYLCMAHLVCLAVLPALLSMEYGGFARSGGVLVWTAVCPFTAGLHSALPSHLNCQLCTAVFVLKPRGTSCPPPRLNCQPSSSQLWMPLNAALSLSRFNSSPTRMCLLIVPETTQYPDLVPRAWA